MALRTNKELQDAALAYSMCGPWAMRTHPKEHFNHGSGQMERYTYFLNGLEAGAKEYAELESKYDDLEKDYINLAAIYEYQLHELNAENERLNKEMDIYKDIAAGFKAIQQQHQQLKDRAQKLVDKLVVIKEQADNGIFPHLPVETVGAAMCINISRLAGESISSWNEGGQKAEAKDALVHLVLANAEEVSKDAETAEEYLKSESVDIGKLKQDAAYIQWKAELIRLVSEASGESNVKINDEEARKWYNDGATPYQCFRETWNME